MRISHEKKFVFFAVPRTASTVLRSALDRYCELIHNRRWIDGAIPTFASSNNATVVAHGQALEGGGYAYADPTNPLHWHTSASTLKKYFKSAGWEWDEYFKFGFVRNPWDHRVSNYLYLKSRWVDNYNLKYDQAVDPFHVYLNEHYRWWFSDYHPWGKFLQFAKRVTSNTFSDAIMRFPLNTHDVNQNLDTSKPLDICPHLFEKNNQLVDFVGRFENLQEDFDYICDKLNIKTTQLPVLNKTNHTHYTDYYTDQTREFVDKIDREMISKFEYTFET